MNNNTELIKIKETISRILIDKVKKSLDMASDYSTTNFKPNDGAIFISLPVQQLIEDKAEALVAEGEYYFSFRKTENGETDVTYVADTGLVTVTYSQPEWDAIREYVRTLSDANRIRLDAEVKKYTESVNNGTEYDPLILRTTIKQPIGFAPPKVG
jgi:hypothetical protein